MNEPDLAQIERVFQEAADLPAAKRAAFLDEACQGAPELRKRVEALLADLERGGSLAPPSTVAPTEGPGTVIGRYKLLQQIGEGGFGVVYMAEQTEPVVRRVALKVIKLGMDTKEVVARFEAERQALALMDHPNIAHVLDGGATDTGRPYFVMELVRGVSITEYCDQNALSTRERLELFVPVCQAVQHAHQKGVIHRDLKPSNVLVTLHDTRPVPKVIDFGVAKAMHGRLTEKTLFTAFERFIGTPAYMSPEQAELSGLDVDTRTDIYALGVLLYELLTGSTPFDARALFEQGLAAVQRTIREEEPERPSVRISTTADAALARQRGSEPPQLSKLLRGDLDWIVLKCLEKDRNRRYGAASDLAVDVERHLRNDPVAAGPPSTSYRLRKFLARNRAAVIGGTAFAVVVLLGLIGTTIGLIEAREQRHLAILERERTQQEVDRTRAVTEFLFETLSLTDPEVALEREPTVGTVLQQAANQAGRAFETQPAAEARIRTTLGRAFHSLGQNERAQQELRRAIELTKAEPEADLVELYDMLWELTHVLFELEEPDSMAIAQGARRVAHDVIRAAEPELAAKLDEFIELINAAAFSADQAAIARVPVVLEETISLSDQHLSVGHELWPIAADTWMAAGYSVWYGPLDHLSERLFARALEIQRRELPASHPQIGETTALLVGALQRTDRHDEAERIMQQSVLDLRRVLPPESPALAVAESMWAVSLAELGRYAEAEEILLPAHERVLASLSDERNFNAAESYGRVLTLYEAWGDEERAQPVRGALARLSAQDTFVLPWLLARRTFGPEHADLVATLDALDAASGGLSFATVPGDGWMDDLPALAAAAVAGFELIAGDDDLELELARLLVRWAGAIDPVRGATERELMVRAALPYLDGVGDFAAVDYGDALSELAAIELGAERRAAALELADRMFETLMASRENDWLLAGARVRAARLFVALGQFARAEELGLSGHAGLVKHFGEQNPDVVEARRVLRVLYEAWGHPEKAAAFEESKE